MQRGWQVITGAESWSPESTAARPFAISSLLPPADSGIALLLQRPGVVSTGAERPTDRASAESTPTTQTPRPSPPALLYGSGSAQIGSGLLDQQLQALAYGLLPGAMPTAQQAQALAGAAATAVSGYDAHSSGRSGSGGGHLDPATLAVVKKEPGTTTAYQLRTRSSSLRASWVEVDEKAEAEAAGEGSEGAREGEGATEDLDLSDCSDESCDSEDEPPASKRKPASKAKGRASDGAKASGAAKGSRKAAPKPKPKAAGSKRSKPDSADGAADAALASEDAGKGDGTGRGSGRAPGSKGASKGATDEAHVSEVERRKIKRRIANRESARRVRAKRAELMDELQIKCTSLSQQNARLLSHVVVLEGQKAVLARQVGELGERLSEKATEAVFLFNQIFQLRRHLSPEVASQAERDAAAAAAPSGGAHINSMFIPVAAEAAPPGPGPAPSAATLAPSMSFDTALQGLTFL